jgi:hypothetical protein
MFSFLTGLGYIIWLITVSVISRLDDILVMMKGDILKMQHPQDIVGSKMLTTGPYQDVVFYVILCFWIFAVIDAYRIGRQNELQDQEMGKIGKGYSANKKGGIK